jgi:hypothetical protein
MVPVKLFNAVVAEVARREESVTRARSERNDFLLRPVCSKCGLPFHGSTAKVNAKGAEGERRRYYQHPRLGPPSSPEQRKQMLAAGCSTQYSIPADALEHAVHAHILETRSSEEYATYVQELISSRIGVVSEARVRVRRLEKEQEELEAEYADTVAAHIAAQRRKLPEKPYLDRMAKVAERLQGIAQELPEAQADAASDANHWESLQGLMQELSAIAVAWDGADNSQKREIFNQWIRSLVIAVEPHASQSRRAKHRFAVLELRTGPAQAVIDVDRVLEEGTVSWVTVSQISSSQSHSSSRRDSRRNEP